MPGFYAFLSNIFKYIFIIIIYLFIFGIMRMIYLDIKKTNVFRPKGVPKGIPYLLLITDKKNLYFEVANVFPLDGASFIIGRGKSCDIVIDDFYLSARHVKLWAENDEWCIEDLKSTNGTYINEIKIDSEPLILDNGDKIRIGQLEFSFGRDWKA